MDSGVVMRGGTSGCRHDYLAPVPDSGMSQPVLDTATSAGVPSTVQMTGGQAGHDYFSGIAEFMPTLPQTPTGGGTGSGTDIEDPGATDGSMGPGVVASGGTSGNKDGSLPPL